MFPKIGISILVAGVAFVFLFACYALAQPPAPPPSLVTHRGGTALWVETDVPLIGQEQYTITFSIDGRRPTQYCGAPEGMSLKKPTAIQWSDDVSAIITYQTGERVLLTLNAQRVQEAKLSRELHFFVEPCFQLLTDHPGVR